ncbi:STAS/SEC14 domain-containing protein [Caenimonas sedimenti]|uniref:STAS/SEC14 domain-containing protein n=1 Tax=Caenimonas sedimenti TaxID=2596921 RepID=A0A562ZP16_9BURK|nr:STAS/SEC14 domain-containing protein [Caenimonas sedimenti]TWO70106.1 STAS/SEC14 domain-containing protein [Caenimonas sedimenti]
MAEEDQHSRSKGYKVKVTQEAGYARLTVVGKPTFDELLSLIHVVGVHSGEWPGELLLLDLRGILTRYSREQEYRVGQEIVTSLGHLRRIASIVPTDRITRLAERAARRSGLRVRVFDDKAEAVEWLTGSDGGQDVPDSSP